MDPVTDNIWIFFGAALVISLSGVMMPGPDFAATVARGYRDEKAGLKIALGHGMVEFPLMALMVLSIGSLFKSPEVTLGIGLVGGALLAVMGVMMIRARKEMAVEGGDALPKSTVVTGVLTTAVNPYFYLWWATVGALLIFTAQEFGAIVVVAFAAVHWSCDLAWYSFTSFAVFRTRHMWTPAVHEIVFIICGALMVGFGVMFIARPTLDLL